MSSSLFSYNLSRPYPFRWFTPATIVGGIIATILFSTVNLATNGYQLKTIYTTNPNGTLSQHYWFTDAPWAWSARLKPSCEAQSLSPGADYFTTNLGLSYTLQRVSQINPLTNTIFVMASLQTEFERRVVAYQGVIEQANSANGIPLSLLLTRLELKFVFVSSPIHIADSFYRYRD